MLINYQLATQFFFISMISVAYMGCRGVLNANQLLLGAGCCIFDCVVGSKVQFVCCSTLLVFSLPSLLVDACSVWLWSAFDVAVVDGSHYCKHHLVRSPQAHLWLFD